MVMWSLQTRRDEMTGKYIYWVEKRSGRGRNFIRNFVSKHSDAADALAAMMTAKVNHEGGWRWMITKQWEAP